MKSIKTLLFITTITIIIIAGLLLYTGKKNAQTQSELYSEYTEENESSRDGIARFYEKLHTPYGSILPDDVNKRILNDLSNVSDENYKSVNSWIAKGPYGMNLSSNPGSYFSGRILDLNMNNNGYTRIAAASGGLWQTTPTILFPVPISDQLNSLVISTFDSKPGDPNTIIAGTGECTVRTGTGLWKTTNGGINWTSIALSPNPYYIFKVRYDPMYSNIVHLVSNYGYYKSTNGGDNFTRYLEGYASDLAINPSNINIMYTNLWSDGIYKTINAGLNWSKLWRNGLPDTNIGRGSISLCASVPNTIYVNLATNDNKTTLGVFKSTNQGALFTKVLDSAFLMGVQGDYNNAIGVCPTNPNLVIAGGVRTVRSSDGGITWNKYFKDGDPLYDPYNLHADVHAIVWGSNGTDVWVASDGGLSHSVNAGLNWSSASNWFPITQYVNIDVGGNGSVIMGGSQDNGISGTSNGGSSWWHVFGGDGAGVAIDPLTPSKIIASVTAPSTSNLDWDRKLTTNYGVTWSTIDNGITNAGTWQPYMRNDRTSPAYIYTNEGAYVYLSTNYGTNWIALNPVAFPSGLLNLNVSKYSSPSAIIYACLNDTTTGQRLRVYDALAWHERSSGLPLRTKINKVAQHPTDNFVAYAITIGLSSTQKVFKTTNRGVTWRNITGNLPNIPFTDLVPHPTDTNKLYLGSEFGCFKTSNGGINWNKWNNGMPMANLVTEMNYIDSISTNGKFYVVAATYGRGIWMREISGDDPTEINNNHSIVTSFELKQNYPNPFNPSTLIKFTLPSTDFVTLKVFDVTGREVAVLVNRKMDLGNHAVTFDGGKLSSGVYFYRITTSKYTDIKKMVFVK